MTTLQLILNIATILLWIILFFKIFFISKELRFIDDGIRLSNIYIPITCLGVSYIYIMIVWWILDPDKKILTGKLLFQFNIFHFFIPITLIFIIMATRRLILSKYILKDKK